jgi:hypothetical protein
MNIIKTFIRITACISLIVYAAQVQAQPFAVVELFTSEGCSSCPPADALLSDIKNKADKNHQNVITLAYHVDYWNRLGWKDPYSKAQFSFRQENYSRIMPGNEMFTPQVIVNGTKSFTGSDKKQIQANIESALREISSSTLSMHIDSTSNDTIYGTYATSVNGRDFSIKFALSEDGLSTRVGSGENSGKELHHDSVVRYLSSVDSPPASGSFRVPLNVFTGKGTRHLTAFVQRKSKMDILVVATSVIN